MYWSVHSFPQSVAVKEPQGAHSLLEHGRGSAFLIYEVHLIGADIFRPKYLWRFAEILGELGNSIDIESLRVGREIPHPHVFDHSLT